MITTDIAIVGGGMAGSTTAAMLGRAGIQAIVVDPHAQYPADFRCEKLDDSQVALLRKTGLAETILAAATRTRCIQIFRHGRLVERRPVNQFSAPYETLVNSARAAIGATASLRVDKVQEIETSADRQVLKLASGESISARLVVIANGLNHPLRVHLGFRHREISHDHSLSIGFDMVPVGGGSFPFEALTYYPEDVRKRIAYLSIFPFSATARANLFVYRNIKDPWCQELRSAPVAVLRQAFPRLWDVTGGFEIPGPVKARPAHLYATEQFGRDGVVLVGDAFATSCPAAGTGFNKVFADVERLANLHVPAWLATPAMTADKIVSFYRDPVKTASDASSLSRAMLTRNVATDMGLRWRTRRAVRYTGQVAVGALRELRAQFAMPGTAVARIGDSK